MEEKYLQTIKDELNKVHQHNEKNLQLLNLAKENILLKLQPLQKQLDEINKLISDYNFRQDRYSNYINTTSGDQSIINNGGEATLNQPNKADKIDQPININGNPTLNFGANNKGALND